jgi:hypothetical protein
VRLIDNEHKENSKVLDKIHTLNDFQAAVVVAKRSSTFF